MQVLIDNEVSSAIQMNSGNVKNTPETLTLYICISFFIRVDQ